MSAQAEQLAALAAHLAVRRGAILDAWRATVRHDPALTSSRTLSRDEVNDHLPALLAAFERDLARPGIATDASAASAVPDAQAHGLHRWRQGYDLRELTRELGRLNECMCVELETYAGAHPHLMPGVMAEARCRWARACTLALAESTSQFFRQQQLEAAGHIDELESALDDLLELEQLRAELWQQAAHDLRGNVAVVANATAGLAADGLPLNRRQTFLDLLQRNVGALNQLLNDVTSLARLQAGVEHRELAPCDAAALLRELCQSLGGMAEQRGLFLRCDGPDALWVQADAVKIRRIAQNLILNALAYTREGGVEVRWGEAPGDPQRWSLILRDSGPGLRTPQQHGHSGEGLGLTIVKRLCDLLEATVEVVSQQGAGTAFVLLFPRRYTQEER